MSPRSPTLPSLRAKPQKAGGEDLADLGEPLGGGHQVGVEGVGQGRDVVGEVRADATSAGVSEPRISASDELSQ